MIVISIVHLFVCLKSKIATATTKLQIKECEHNILEAHVLRKHTNARKHTHNTVHGLTREFSEFLQPIPLGRDLYYPLPGPISPMPYRLRWEKEI